MCLVQNSEAYWLIRREILDSVPINRRKNQFWRSINKASVNLCLQISQQLMLFRKKTNQLHEEGRQTLICNKCGCSLHMNCTDIGTSLADGNEPRDFMSCTYQKEHQNRRIKHSERRWKATRKVIIKRLKAGSISTNVWPQ